MMETPITFRQELQALMKKYSVEIEEYPDYDEEENYVGSHYYFVGEDIFSSLYDFID